KRRVLERALHVYRFRTGHYPNRLDALVAEGLLEPSDLEHPVGGAFFYAPRREGFDLGTPLR
ncbi:MAG: hypothetical protein AAFU79_20535, partial [Myxococcota bacterium]